MNKITPVDKNIREKIREELNKSFLVEASAGTGKTTCLVDRITNALIKEKVRPHELAAITFTKAAASELRLKVLLKLFNIRAAEEDELEKEKISKVIAMMGSAEISTIHSFYGRLLSERPVESGLDSQVKVLEEENNVPERIWMKYLEDNIESFIRYEDILFVLEVLSVSMDSFKDFCFKSTNYPDLSLKGLPEALNREDMISETIKLFEDFTVWIPSSISKCNNPDNDIYCGEVRGMLDTWERLKDSPKTDRFAYAARMNKVTEVKNQEMDNWDKVGRKNQGKAESEEAQRQLNNIKSITSDYLYLLNYELFEHFRSFFEEYKRRHSVITFVDSLMKARDMLREHPEARKYFRDKFKMILVDEFQDTDPVQAEVIAILSSDDENIEDWRDLNIMPGKLFVVGDPKQSIYRFRRADITIYEEFKRLFNSEENQVLKLKQNFRSYPGITDFVNSAFEERMKADENLSSPAYEPIESMKETGGGVIILNMDLTLPTDPDDYSYRGALKVDYLRPREQEAFAAWLKDTVESGALKRASGEKVEYGDILILFKVTTSIGGWEKALAEKGIPVENISSKDFFERAEVKEAVAILTAAGCPSDTMAVYGALKSSAFGLSDTEIFSIVRDNKSLNLFKINNLESIPPTASSAIKRLKKLSKDSQHISDDSYAGYLLRESGLINYYANILKSPGAVSSLMKISSAMEALVLNEGVDFYCALERLSDMTDEEEKSLYLESERPSGVRLMSIHQAKGLESPVVVLGDLSQGRVDSRFADKYIDRASQSYYKTYSARRAESHEDAKDFNTDPLGWEELKNEEVAFMKQEELRLEYVLSTRASEHFILLSTHKPSGFSKELLETAHNIPVKEEVYINYGSISRGEKSELKIPPSDDKGLDKYLKDRESKIKSFVDRYYVRENPSRMDENFTGLDEGYGTEHGNTVHGILKYIFDNPGEKIDYKKYERDEIVEEQVGRVVNSSIWKRALEAREAYAELPILLYNEDKRKLIRGVIDLVFKENDGWVIADYKTNKITGSEKVKELKEKYSSQMDSYKRVFEELTGERVKETVVLFLDEKVIV